MLLKRDFSLLCFLFSGSLFPILRLACSRGASRKKNAKKNENGFLRIGAVPCWLAWRCCTLGGCLGALDLLFCARLFGFLLLAALSALCLLGACLPLLALALFGLGAAALTLLKKKIPKRKKKKKISSAKRSLL